jgi:hypothetical protein
MRSSGLLRSIALKGGSRLAGELDSAAHWST